MERTIKLSLEEVEAILHLLDSYPVSWPLTETTAQNIRRQIGLQSKEEEMREANEALGV
jgi:hypothetical protein